MQYYGVIRSNTWLAHHGKRGQKWGVRHGPPNPLDRKTSSYEAAKKIADSLSDAEKKHVFGSKAYSDSKYSIYRKVARRNGEPSSFIEVYKDPDLKSDEAIVITATNPKYRGHGDSKELTKMLTSNMPKGINKLYWETDTGNIASMKIAEKSGFRRIKGMHSDDAIYVYKRR